MAGWRWLFILEGIPAILLGVTALLYLTDWPSEAAWLPANERDWLVSELKAELRAKKGLRDYTILQAYRNPRVLLLAAVYFLAITGVLANIYWIPTFIKRLSGLPNQAVTSLLIIPAVIGIVGSLMNAWHSDKTGERRWHTAVPLLVAGFMYGLAVASCLNYVPAAISVRRCTPAPVTRERSRGT